MGGGGRLEGWKGGREIGERERLSEAGGIDGGGGRGGGENGEGRIGERD